MGSRTINIPQLRVEESNELDSWARFIKRFKIATIGMKFKEKLAADDATDQTREEQHRKGAALLHSIGEEGMTIFDTFNVDVDDIEYDSLVKKFEEHFAGRENKLILRHRFLNCKQMNEERITVYISRVSGLAAKCALGGMRDDLVVQIVINNMISDKLRKELLITRELTLDVLKELCARFEAADRTREELKGREEVFEIDRMQIKGAAGGIDGSVERDGAHRYSPRRDSPKRGSRCYACGDLGHFASSTLCRFNAPSRGVSNMPTRNYRGYSNQGRGYRQGMISCFSCGEVGHYSSQCSSKSVNLQQFKVSVPTCFSCGEKGHLKRECDKERRDEYNGNWSSNWGDRGNFRGQQRGNVRMAGEEKKAEDTKPL